MPKNVKVQFSYKSKTIVKNMSENVFYGLSFTFFFGELVAHTGDQVIYFNTYLGLHLGDSRLILESWHRYIMCLSIFGGFSCK